MMQNYYKHVIFLSLYNTNRVSHNRGTFIVLDNNPYWGWGLKHPSMSKSEITYLNTDAKALFKMLSRLKYMGGGVWNIPYILIVYGQSCGARWTKGIPSPPPPTPTENSKHKGDTVVRTVQI